MFGYITVCREAISAEGFDTFKSYYCGLCKATGKLCSHLARLALSYDITFLAIVLSAVYDEECDTADKRCVLHPIRKNKCVVNDIPLNYAANMGVILTYLKLLDDWHDDKSIKALCAMALLYGGVRKAKKRYKNEYEKIKQLLDKLGALEKNNCSSVDETADCFANILKILFTPDFITDDRCRRVLEWLGYNIGRWIYIIDAYNDLERDIKNRNYNVFAASSRVSDALEIKRDIAEKIEMSLTFTLENAASAYNLLEIRKNKEILDNILYTALKLKQNNILGGNNESV